MLRRTDIAITADGLLADFAQAGAINSSGVHLARTLGWASGESNPEVLLAAALCLSVQQAGSVCLPLDQAAQLRFVTEVAEEPTAGDPPATPTWPEVEHWLGLLANSPLVAVGAEPPANQRPLRLVGRQLYLERNWLAEEQVRLGLQNRLTHAAPAVDQARLDAALTAAFAGFAPAGSVRQRSAVATSATTWTSVIAGGPGTGKTTTIAQLLRVLDELADRRLDVALASFTGKAAARMQQSLDASLAASGSSAAPWRHLEVAPASTLHSLLAARPHAGFGRNADNPLPHDLLIIDEASMISLDLMAAVLAALRPTTRLVLVGDPHQLSSVDAGAVLADVVTAGLPLSRTNPASAITVLDYSHRFSGPIGTFAAAIAAGEADQALDLLAADQEAFDWVQVDPDPNALAGLSTLAADLVAQGRVLHTAALAGQVPQALTALDAHRLLCAHRHGRYGVTGWSRAVEQFLRGRLPGYGTQGEWYLGRPVLITRNAAELEVFNGDTGVVVAVGGRAEVALSAGGQTSRLRSPWLLDSSETMHALTVHKSQGSEYETVSLVLPAQDSPLLTNELLYTAVTRARSRVRIIGTAEAIRQAIATPARRASGLGERLRLPQPGTI